MTIVSEHRVLVVAGEFPPVKTIGRIRTVKFVEQLRQYGWRASVITIEPPPGAAVPELLQEIPADIEVYRVPVPDLEAAVATRMKRLLGRLDNPTTAVITVQTAASDASVRVDSREQRRSVLDALHGMFTGFLRNWVYIPDSYLPWARRAYRLALTICQTRPIEVVYTTLPPFSAALLGYRLRRRTGIPWVVDYRDLWFGDVLREWINPVRRKLELQLERYLMRRADVIIAVSEQKTAYLQKLHPASHIRWETLTNGYDPETYDLLLTEPRRPDEFIDFVYTGRLFKNRRGYAFAEALGQLAAERPELVAPVRIHILGGIAPEIRARYDEILARYGITRLFRFPGDVSHHEAMRAQVQTDYLLLIVDTGETSDGVIPGKLFEYVAARRPIFALTNPGATQAIIERARLGWVVPAESVEPCKAALAEVLSQPVPEQLAADTAYLSQFERRKISRRLARIFDEVATTR
ncbi:MAG: glycosyltransferase [Candidatus Competibacteraceae bacterium]